MHPLQMAYILNQSFLHVLNFHRIGPLGRFGLVVAMSVHVLLDVVPFPCNFCMVRGGASLVRGLVRSVPRLAWSPKNGEVFRIVDPPPFPPPLAKKKLFTPFLTPAETKLSVLLSASVERFFILFLWTPKRAFFSCLFLLMHLVFVSIQNACLNKSIFG